MESIFFPGTGEFPFEFDEEAWIESLMTCEAAERFAKGVILQAIYHALAMRDKTWITEGIHEDAERQKAWSRSKWQKASEVYRRLILRLPGDLDEP